MSDHWKSLMDYFPFFSLIVGRTQSPIITRLVETAIMSAVAGGFATYIGVELLRQDVSTLKSSIEKIDTKVEKLDGKVEGMRHDLYVPRGGH